MALIHLGVQLQAPGFVCVGSMTHLCFSCGDSKYLRSKSKYQESLKKKKNSSFRKQNYIQLIKVTGVKTPASTHSIPLRHHKAAVIGLLAESLAAGQKMLPEMHMMPFLDEKLPAMLPAVGEWRLSLFRAVDVFCNYSAAAFETIAVISQCNEILLRVALAFTNSLSFYLSTMLRLNSFLRRTLAGVLFSREELDQHGYSSCSGWPSSQTFRNNRSSPLCCRGERPARWLKSVQSALNALPGLCRRSRSVCVTMLALFHVAPSALLTLCSDLRPSVSTIMTLCGFIRSLLSTLQTVTGYSTKIVGIIWDLPSVTGSP